MDEDCDDCGGSKRLIRAATCKSQCTAFRLELVIIRILSMFSLAYERPEKIEVNINTNNNNLLLNNSSKYDSIF